MDISPGKSWYEETAKRHTYPELNQNTKCDVCVVGGGFCGASTALHLAENKTNVVLLEQGRLGDGASGRNGGQMGSGQNLGVTALEGLIGRQKTKALWEIAEDAKKSLIEVAKKYEFEVDYINGQLTPAHHKRYEKKLRREVENLNKKYGYEHIKWVNKKGMAEMIGSNHYHGGIQDDGTGHIHPMKYIVGLGQAALTAGAKIFEQTKVTKVEKKDGGFLVHTKNGNVKAEQVVLALNGYHGDIYKSFSRYVAPIRSYIGATPPLNQEFGVLPDKHAVDDTRHAVRYFRMTNDNRLLFGGRSPYGGETPNAIKKTIKGIMEEVFPQLQNTELTHAWGGNVAVTVNRMPYVSETQGLWCVGGFSGHGVMMANFTGKLIAEYIANKGGRINLLKETKHKSFPGGKWLRTPTRITAMTWYSMVDKI